VSKVFFGNKTKISINKKKHFKFDVCMKFSFNKFLLKMENNINQKESPLIEEIEWGFMKVEGFPSGKDFKLFPGGKIYLTIDFVV